ncbi:MAG TPA: glycerol-3-phosphate 1-O-acyltransferase PlsY [Vicinamibacterales bacterium]|nr:glycerol-3-phosphate 1-O-acyltransferase PlsY [Vicinamibacterales bacterium]
MDALIPLLVGYGVGSLPLGYLVANRLKGLDLRRVGSGNVGAANVYRTAGLTIAVIVVCIDVAKGASSVALAARVTTGAAGPVAAGVAAIIGHVYPVWLRFQGGKGVATACGVFSVLAPLATVISLGVFVATVSVTRYVSLGSVVATAALAPLAWITDRSIPVVAGSVLAAALIIQRHRANLARLHHGTERRLGQKA